MERRQLLLSSLRLFGGKAAGGDIVTVATNIGLIAPDQSALHFSGSLFCEAGCNDLMLYVVPPKNADSTIENGVVLVIATVSPANGGGLLRNADIALAVRRCVLVHYVSGVHCLPPLTVG